MERSNKKPAAMFPSIYMFCTFTIQILLNQFRFYNFENLVMSLFVNIIMITIFEITLVNIFFFLEIKYFVTM